MDSIKKISIKDREYPLLLKKIKNPPKVLYYRGEITVKNCFAIVGSRLCSSYGKEIAFEIAGELAEAGLTIVSGLAPGIDTIAHQATLEKGGKTIAVLGTGLDEKSIYPKENIELAQRIVEKGGCLLSEYPPGTHGSKLTFPKRNRIIAGLSLGVLVVEAKLRSGALITAQRAKEQERKIFAVPGSVYSLTSKGCHYLIKNGAKLVENVEDILKELKISARPKFSNLKTNETLTNEERLILETLKEGALDINKLIEKTKLKASIVASTLAILEIKNKIRNLEEGTYAIKR